MRRMRIFAALAVASTVALVFALVGRSEGGPQFDVINGTVVAAADHMSAGNDAFPNFATGAIDNRYPLASAHVDNLSTQGFGSPLDTGPLGQTGAAAAGVTQPQYASAKYPPKATTSTVGNPPVTYATAKAGPDSASTDAAAGRSPGSAPASAEARQTMIDRLNRALRSWRSEFLTADDQARYPFVAATASDPDGGDGLSAFTTSTFDPNAGLLTVDADSRVSHASFGGGAIQFDNIRMHVTIANNGTPQRKITINVGGASVGGVPITVGAGGVSVAGTAVPGTSGLSDQANAGLNQALASAGFTIYTIAPSIATGTNTTSVEATALRVRWQGGDIQPGVPRSFVEHDLGEAFAFSLATPSIAVPSVPAVVGGVTQNAPSSTFIPGSPGTPGSPGSSSPGVSGGTPTSQTAALPPSRSVASKPLWLLLLYFAWQSSIIGAAASLWLWRKEPV
jgi:hypothetical protein